LVGGEEVGRLAEEVLVAALLDAADAAEGGAVPALAAGADDQCALDQVGEQRARADELELALRVLRLDEEVVAQDAGVVEGLELLRRLARHQAVEVEGDVVEVVAGLRLVE